MNLNYFFKRKKITCFFVLLSILIFASNISFAAEDSYKPRSLFETVMTQGIFSINVPPDPPPSILPPAGAIPIDYRIKLLNMQDSFVTFPDAKTGLRQARLKVLRENRPICSKWSYEGINKLDSYVISHRGSLDALNNIQNFAEIVKCLQAGGTPEQCAQKAGKDALMRLAGGHLMRHLGLGTLGTIGALAMADIEAVRQTVKLYNEVTGLIEDEKTAEKQKSDRMALGAGVGSMKSYLELMRVRYEQNQNSVGDLLIKFWEDAEDQSKRLKTAEDQFTIAWKEIENKNYSGQLQNNCVKGCNLDEKCSTLINSYTVLTGTPLPEAGANTSLLRREFQKALNNDFEKKCMEHSDDIKEKIETIIQKKVDPLHNGYKSLEFYITHAIQAREKYLADQKKSLQRNKNLNLHYEQQLAERYGKDSDKYKEGMAVLNRITNQIKTYQPQRLKGNMKYISKRLDRIEEDFEFTGKKLVRIFDDIETDIEEINTVEKSFKTTARSKSEKLAAKFGTCADERISNQAASLADETKDNAQVKKLCNETKNAAKALFVKIQNNEKKFISFGDKLKKFFKKLKGLKKESKFITTAHKDLEKKAADIAEISHDLEKLVLKICETTKELNDHTKTDSEHDRNYYWINNEKERLKERLDSAKNIIKDAESLDKESKKRLEAVKLLQDTSQKAFQEMSKDIEALLETNLGNSMDELNQKAAMISADDCPEDVFAALREATKRYQKNQDKLKQITAFYKSIKIDFDKKIEEVKNLDRIYQKTAYLLDLSKAYVERAKNAAVKGAFCAVLAENIMKKVFIPDVRGSQIGEAESRVRQKGLNVTGSKLGPPPLEGKAGKVENILPDITKRVKKGSNVTLSYYDKRSDRASWLANLDCSQWPGSEELVDLKTGKSECGCANGKVWNADKTECVNTDSGLPSSEEIQKASRDVQLSQTNCSQWPGSQPVWDKQNNKASCGCTGNMVWNSDNSACIDSRQAALENLDCSQYPGTIPSYDNNGNLVCACPDGAPWIQNLNRCANQQDVAIANNDCSQFPGTVPNYDNNGNLGCACPNGTQWIQNMNRCVSQQDIAMANTDCSHLPGSAPTWSYITNQVECECQSPYSRDPLTGKCEDWIAKAQRDNEAFNQEMENTRKRNQEQQQQFVKNMWDIVSPPNGPGNSTTQNNYPQNHNASNNNNSQGNYNQSASSSSSKKPVYCGVWQVSYKIIQHDDIRKGYGSSQRGKTFKRCWKLYPSNGGKTIKFHEYESTGKCDLVLNGYLEFTKPGLSGSNYSITHTWQTETRNTHFKSVLKLSITGNSFQGTWIKNGSNKSTGKNVYTKKYSLTGISKKRSYN